MREKMDAMLGDMVEGRVARLASRGCFVEIPSGGRLRCELRGAAKGGKRSAKHPVAVGDRVRVLLSSPGEGVVEEVLPRTTILSRLTPGRRYEQVLAANADAVMAITATKTPPFRPGLVDRVLLAAEMGDLEGWVCLNKTDLAGPEKFEADLEGFRRAGYRVFTTSARTGEGMPDLKAALSGKRVVLVGHSGVGKSSILNLLCPGLELEVQEVSRKTKRGVHTTTSPEIFHLDDSSSVIDTPGVREFHPFGVSRRNLWTLFPEMGEIASECKFTDCLHLRELGCRILEAVESGAMDRGRHERYVRILDSIGADPRRGR